MENPTGTSARKRRTASSDPAPSSIESPTTCTSGRAAASRASRGNAFLHGAQYVAHTSSTRTWPRTSSDAKVPPSRSGKVIDGSAPLWLAGVSVGRG
jgi:hypothetical protein